MMSIAPVDEDLSVRRRWVLLRQIRPLPGSWGTALLGTPRTDLVTSVTKCSPPPCPGPMPASSVWLRAGRSITWPALTANWTMVGSKIHN